jgi:hypothetical protein
MRAVVLFTMLWSGLVQAMQSDAQCDRALCWQVQPVVCIANQTADSCALDFQLSWQHPQPISVCAELAPTPFPSAQSWPDNHYIAGSNKLPVGCNIRRNWMARVNFTCWSMARCA